MTGSKGGLTCTECGGKLRRFRVTRDWSERELHKKCWLLQQDREFCRVMYGSSTPSNAPKGMDKYII